MKTFPLLALDELANYGPAEVRDQVARWFEVPREKLDPFDFLVAIVSDFGYESSAFFLVVERETGKLFEVHAGHCSCYGYEGQWKPEPTTAEYLRSGKFSPGYFNGGEETKKQILDYVAANIIVVEPS